MKKIFAIAIATWAFSFQAHAQQDANLLHAEQVMGSRLYHFLVGFRSSRQASPMTWIDSGRSLVERGETVQRISTWVNWLNQVHVDELKLSESLKIRNAMVVAFISLPSDPQALTNDVFTTQENLRFNVVAEEGLNAIQALFEPRVSDADAFVASKKKLIRCIQKLRTVLDHPWMTSDVDSLMTEKEINYYTELKLKFELELALAIKEAIQSHQLNDAQVVSLIRDLGEGKAGFQEMIKLLSFKLDFKPTFFSGYNIHVLTQVLSGMNMSLNKLVKYAELPIPEFDIWSGRKLDAARAIETDGYVVEGARQRICKVIHGVMRK